MNDRQLAGTAPATHPLGPHPRTVIVFNPAAGNAGSLQGDLEDCCELLSGYGWSVELWPTASPGDGTRLARAAAEQGYDAVIAAGGDGTINEIVNGLAGSPTALGVLPVGTVNVWAREIGLPLQPRATTEALLKTQVRSIDLGRAGERYFLLMAGVGFDAAVVNEVRGEEKRRLGALAYVLRAIELSRRFRGTRARLRLDETVLRRRVLLVVLGNTQLYAGVLKITPRARIDDGLLDVCIIKGNTLLDAPLRLLSIVLQRHSVDRKLEYHRARTIRIEARPALPVQVDGELIGQTPMTIEAVPLALRVLLPPTMLDTDLLQAPARAQRSWRRLLGWVGRRASHNVETGDSALRTEW
jgi:YegS/Rv2252/BmrU family lipid kinase